MRATVVGGGLAGCEAAWQLAERGVSVTLHEMRPARRTEVHQSGDLAELVCSNSLRSDKLDNAVGLLKEEMRRLGSLVMRVADEVRVPAGAALAVDRERFARRITEEVSQHQLITVLRDEVTAVPSSSGNDAPAIIATGPLTSSSLADDIARFVGQAHLYFYDAISPIVLAETIDRSRVFRASRWGRSLRAGEPANDGADGDPAGKGCAAGAGGDAGDYLNCPMDASEYRSFYEALTTSEVAPLHGPDKEQFFEGCLPIEVMARRGPDTLRFGPMKPVGLPDPRTGSLPYAVVQLRQDNLAADHYSLVGFQTQLKWGEQARVFRLIPGLESAEFVRFGLVHRNTYINSPTVLTDTWQTRSRPDLLFAGQISGVEGYVESAASGLLAGISAASLARGLAPPVPPRTTALGSLAHYVSHADSANYQPTNITFGIVAPIETLDRRLRRDRKARNEAIAARALEDLGRWARASPLASP